MSEYIEIEAEASDDGMEIHFLTNLLLAEGGEEVYESAAALEEGSPVAQALAPVFGIGRLRMQGNELYITPEPEADWHAVIADVTAALKEFFL
jgi:hypothetical protein